MARPQAAEVLEVVPSHTAWNLPRHKGRDRLGARARLGIRRPVVEPRHPAPQVAGDPSRMHQRLQRLRPFELQRQLEAVAQVALALGGNRHVDRQYQGAQPSVVCTPDHVFGNLAVARRVELVPGMARRQLRGRLDRGGGSARHDERDVGGGRGPGQYEIGVRTKQRRKAGRRDAERARVAAAEQGGGLAAPINLDQVARHDAMAREAGLVGHQTVLVLDAALDKVEHDPRQPPSGEPAQIVDIHRVRDCHVFTAIPNLSPMQIVEANSARRFRIMARRRDSLTSAGSQGFDWLPRREHRHLRLSASCATAHLKSRDGRPHGAHMVSNRDLEEAVAAMLGARSGRRPLRRLPPGGAPLTLDDAYAIQEAFVYACGWAVAGYKIGCASQEAQALVGASGPFAARIFAPTRLDSPAEISVRDFLTLGVEAEFGFTMRDGLPPRAAPYDRADVARAVAAVSPVIELCDTRLENWKTARIEEIIADNGFHGGLVVGTAVSEWQSLELAAHEVALSINGAVRASGASAGSLGHPLDGLVWLANELSRRGYGLGRGDIIATGTWTGLHFVREPAAVV